MPATLAPTARPQVSDLFGRMTGYVAGFSVPHQRAQRRLWKETTQTTNALVAADISRRAVDPNGGQTLTGAADASSPVLVSVGSGSWGFQCDAASTFLATASAISLTGEFTAFGAVRVGAANANAILAGGSTSIGAIGFRTDASFYVVNTGGTNGAGGTMVVGNNYFYVRRSAGGLVYLALNGAAEVALHQPVTGTIVVEGFLSAPLTLAYFNGVTNYYTAGSIWTRPFHPRWAAAVLRQTRSSLPPA